MEERKRLLERSLAEYRRELRRAELSGRSEPSSVNTPANTHYQDYLRAVVHALTAPAHVASSPSTRGDTRAPFSEEESPHVSAFIHYLQEVLDQEAGEDTPEEGVEEDTEEEETIRGIPVTEYDDAVERYMAYMSAYLDEQETRYAAREADIPESGTLDEDDDEGDEEDEDVCRPEDDDDDLVWMWCPDCCLRLCRSIAKMDMPCGVCGERLALALPLDWEDRQLQRFRGPRQAAVTQAAGAGEDGEDGDEGDAGEEEREEEREDGEDGEEAEGRPAVSPPFAVGYPRLRWCPQCQDTRHRREDEESYCLICHTELTDDLPQLAGSV